MLPMIATTIGTMLVLGSGGPSIEDLISKAALNQGNIDTLSITFEVSQFEVSQNEVVESPRPATPEWWIPHYKLSVTATIDESMFYMRKQIRPAGEDDLGAEQHVSYDGALGMYATPAFKIGRLSLDRPPYSARTENDVLVAAKLLPGSAKGNGLDDGNLVNLLKHSTLREATEIINGFTCRVVDTHIDGHHIGSYWLDLSRGASIIRAIEYRTGGEVGVEINVFKMHRFADGAGKGTWLPVDLHLDVIFPDFHIRKAVVVDIKQTHLNPPTDGSTYRMVFAPGTRISDSRSGEFLLAYKTIDGTFDPVGSTPADAVVFPIDGGERIQPAEKKNEP